MRLWTIPQLAWVGLAVVTCLPQVWGEELWPAPITVTGKSACAQCEGIAKGHDIALTTENGVTFVLKGKGDDYKAAHKVRKQGKVITATLMGAITPMSNDAGEPYLEAAVSGVQIKSDGVNMPVTIAGKSACAQCEGIAKGHDIALKTQSGITFVLKGKGDDYKAVHKVRSEGRLAVATLSGAIAPRQNEKGQPYLEAQVSTIKLAPAAPVTVMGVSACAQCEGIAKGHDVALKTENGVIFVLKGEGDDYKAVHQVRSEGKTIAATLDGDLKPMKNDKGEPYLEVRVSTVKVAA